MNPLISVIVPIYKVEKYLEICINSIINQTYKNLEIILIDDGSPDNCPKICDEYAIKDSRVRVIHLENGGAGRARNIGFSISNGEYISFIDSDDFISEYFYEYLINLFNDETDIVECGYISIMGSEKNCFNLDEDNSIVKSYSIEEAMREHIYDNIFRQVIWNKLYRRRVVENIKFPENSKIDDEYWTYQAIANCNYLLHSDKIMYAYRQQENSVMHNLSSNDRIKAIEPKVLRANYIKQKLPDLYNEAVYSVWGACLYQCQYLFRTNKKDSKNLYKYCKNIKCTYNLSVLKLNRLSVKEKFWMLLFKISIKGTCYLRNFLKIGI